jgi:hypothetical protein
LEVAVAAVLQERPVLVVQPLLLLRLTQKAAAAVERPMDLMVKQEVLEVVVLAVAVLEVQERVNKVTLEGMAEEEMYKPLEAVEQVPLVGILVEVRRVAVAQEQQTLFQVLLLLTQAAVAGEHAMMRIFPAPEALVVVLAGNLPIVGMGIMEPQIRVVVEEVEVAI